MKSHRARSNWRTRLRLLGRGPQQLGSAPPWKLLRTTGLAVALGLLLVVIGARMLRNQESAVARELHQKAEESARTLPAQIERALREDLSPQTCPVSLFLHPGERAADSVPATAKTQTPPHPSRNARCRDAELLLPTAATPAERSAAATTLTSECPTARGALGTLLVPNLLVEQKDAASLHAWFEVHAQELTAQDRRVLRHAILDAHFTENEETSLIAHLRSKGLDAVQRDRVLLARLAAPEQRAEATIHIVRGDSTLALLRRGNGEGRDVAAVLDADELVRCASTRLQLPKDLRLELADPAKEESATQVRLAPELLFDVVPQRAELVRERTQETRRALGILFAATVLLLAALFSAGVVRTRRAETLAELRTDFAAAIAHELRTPLTSMRILTELLAEDALSDEDRRTATASLLDQTKRLASTAERMLTLRSLMVGKTIPTRSAVKLQTLLEAAVADLEARAPALSVQCTFPEDATADSDPALLRVIVDNLLENAWKYAGGPREVAVREQNGTWEIAIRDEGPGIPDAAKPRLFEPFERADAKLSTTTGAGLGLAIVRYAAEALGATVGVRDATPKGSIFFVRIPKRDITATREDATPNETEPG